MIQVASTAGLNSLTNCCVSSKSEISFKSNGSVPVTIWCSGNYEHLKRKNGRYPPSWANICVYFSEEWDSGSRLITLLFLLPYHIRQSPRIV
jgi:hypothetical protein